MKRTLVMLVSALLLTSGFVAFADCEGPRDGAGEGNTQYQEPPEWAGTCSGEDEVLTVLDEEPFDPPGKNVGWEKDPMGKGTMLQLRDGSCCD